jgi:hypothetical protein
MALEPNTSLLVGNDFDYINKVMLNTNHIAIPVLQQALLRGSTPHAGTCFPMNDTSDLNSTKPIRSHVRILITITPKNNKVGFKLSVQGKSQHKICKPACKE